MDTVGDRPHPGKPDVRRCHPYLLERQMQNVEFSWTQAPFDWQHDCGTRMSQCTPQDTAGGMFLNGMLKSIRLLAGEAVAKRCLEATGHERLVDVFNYPAT